MDVLWDNVATSGALGAIIYYLINDLKIRLDRLENKLDLHIENHRGHK